MTDICQSAKAIAGQLAANRRLRDSDEIIAAIRAGFTGTEILMRLRHTLVNIDTDSLPHDLVRRIKALVLEVDRLVD